MLLFRRCCCCGGRCYDAGKNVVDANFLSPVGAVRNAQIDCPSNGGRQILLRASCHAVAVTVRRLLQRCCRQGSRIAIEISADELQTLLLPLRIIITSISAALGTPLEHGSSTLSCDGSCHEVGLICLPPFVTDRVVQTREREVCVANNYRPAVVIVVAVEAVLLRSLPTLDNLRDALRTRPDGGLSNPP